MELEKQVVSKDLALEMEKKGYKQEGIWWWYYNDPCTSTDDLARGVYGFWAIKTEGAFVAPTCAELSIAFSKYFEDNKTIYIFCDEGHWFAQLRWTGFGRMIHGTEDALLVNAMGKMWIWLAENNLLNPTGENKT